MKDQFLTTDYTDGTDVRTETRDEGRSSCAKATEDRVSRARVATAVVMVLLVCLALGGGCFGTVTPKHVAVQTVSFDGDTQNAGLWRGTNGQAYLTASGTQRYVGLMVQYGSNWAIAPGHAMELKHVERAVVYDLDGRAVVVSNLWEIDSQHLFYFGTANRWKKEGK